MSERQLPPIKEALAYWHRGQITIALHGEVPADDRTCTLSQRQALRLAEFLIRAVREASE